MKTKRDETHDSLVATYQSLEATILNKVLIENKILDIEKRREIISSFLFEQGVILDQYWFEDEGNKWFPGVYFSNFPHDKIDKATVYLPSEEYGMNFHEYAHGAADWALENDPDEIKTGND